MVRRWSYQVLGINSARMGPAHSAFLKNKLTGIMVRISTTHEGNWERHRSAFFRNKLTGIMASISATHEGNSGIHRNAFLRNKLTGNNGWSKLRKACEGYGMAFSACIVGKWIIVSFEYTEDFVWCSCHLWFLQFHNPALLPSSKFASCNIEMVNLSEVTCTVMEPHVLWMLACERGWLWKVFCCCVSHEF